MNHSTQHLIRTSIASGLSLGKKVVLLAVIGILAACSTGGRNREKSSILGSRFIPTQPGERIAAVLVKGSTVSRGSPGANLNPVHQTPTQGQGQNGLHPVHSGGTSPVENANATDPRTGCSGQIGYVQMMAINPKEQVFVGDDRTFVNRFQRSALSSGFHTRLTSVQLPVAGITDESQLEFSSDGSVLFVTLTECNQVVAISVLDNGAIGGWQQFGTDPNPTEIATKRTPYFGEVAAVTTRLGVSLFTVDRIYGPTGVGQARFLLNRSPVPAGWKVTTINFTPDGEWLIRGINPGSYSPVNRSGGVVEFCNLELLSGGFQDPANAFIEQGFTRGCVRGNPRTVTGRGTEPFNPFSGSGTQRFSALPAKIAVNDQMAVFLDQEQGPVRIATPEDVGIADYFQLVLPSTFFNRFSEPGSGGQGGYTDIAIHPLNNSLLFLQNGTLRQGRTENLANFGAVSNVIATGGKLVALSMDPTFGDFFLAADTQDGSVRTFLTLLDTVAGNPDFDKVKIGGGNDIPIDVAIRPVSPRP